MKPREFQHKNIMHYIHYIIQLKDGNGAGEVIHLVKCGTSLPHIQLMTLANSIGKA